MKVKKSALTLAAPHWLNNANFHHKNDGSDND